MSVAQTYICLIPKPRSFHCIMVLSNIPKNCRERKRKVGTMEYYLIKGILIYCNTLRPFSGVDEWQLHSPAIFFPVVSFSAAVVQNHLLHQNCHHFFFFFVYALIYFFFLLNYILCPAGKKVISLQLNIKLQESFCVVEPLSSERFPLSEVLETSEDSGKVVSLELVWEVTHGSV